MGENDTGIGTQFTNSACDNGMDTVTACYGYDPQARLGSALTMQGSQLNTQNVAARDQDGNLGALPNGLSTASYDKSDELTSAGTGGSATTYGYDGDGQLATETQAGTRTVTATADAAGNITSYDNINASANSGANMSSATYNGDGLRVADSIQPAGGSSTNQNFTYDLAGDPGLLMDGSYAFIYAPDGSPVEQVSLSTGKVNYLLTDANGSVRAVLDGSSGAIDATTTYDSFGNPTTTPLTQGGVNYPGLTEYTPMGAGAAYTGPSGLQTADGSTLTDNGTGQGLTSLAATGSRSGHVTVFWNDKAHGNGSAQASHKGWGACKTKGPGWIYTGSTNIGNVPCSGYFYGEGDHCGPLGGFEWDCKAVDWQLVQGQPVLAQAPGKVVFSGWWDCSKGWYGKCGHGKTYGQAIVVRYQAPTFTAWYGHLSKLRVHRGHVAQGQVLGFSGLTGNTRGLGNAYHGAYADHVHVGWGKGVQLVHTGRLKGTVDFAAQDLKQATKSMPLYTGRRKTGHDLSNGLGPIRYTSLHEHQQYASCIP